jgi:hypothetical protein
LDVLFLVAPIITALEVFLLFFFVSLLIFFCVFRMVDIVVGV